MGYFYNKFLEISVITPQTDDFVGNDLNGIEKAIAGSDGIEAHRDEVEDAAEGLIGDPVDECMVIIAEGEYNWNKFMKQLGIQELYEVATGNTNDEKEESKIKKLATNFVKWLRQIWEKIKALFENNTTKIKINIKKAKKFINGTTMLNFEDGLKHAGISNKEIIEKGFNDGEWEFNSPDLYYNSIILNKLNNIKYPDAKNLMFCASAFTNQDSLTRSLINDCISIDDSSINVFNISDMIDELEKRYLAIKTYKSGKVAEDLIEVCYQILSDETLKKIDENYKTLKDQYNKFLNDPSYIIKLYESGSHIIKDEEDLPSMECFTNTLKISFNISNAIMNWYIKYISTLTIYAYRCLKVCYKNGLNLYQK